MTHLVSSLLAAIWVRLQWRQNSRLVHRSNKPYRDFIRNHLSSWSQTSQKKTYLELLDQPVDGFPGAALC